MPEDRADAMIVSMRDVDLGAGLEEFERALDAALAARPRVLALDLAAVDRVSSTTVAMLLWARRRCASEGVAIVLKRPSRRCREALDRTGLLREMAAGSRGGR